MKTLSARLLAFRGPMLIAFALTTFALAVLLPGFQLAGRLDDTTAALRLVSEQRRQADVIAAALGALRDRLDNFGYVDEPLNEVRNSIAELDALGRTLRADPTQGGRFTANASRPIVASAELTADAVAFEDSWQHFRHGLVPVSAFQGVPYADSESSGVHLNVGGKLLAQESRKAIVVARKDGVRVTAALGQLAGGLEAESARLSSYLRLLMLVALAGTAVFGVVLAYFALARRRQALQLADARRQTEGILQTVKEGLFLLDTKGRIGAAHSASMKRLFKVEKLAGVSFEELLKPLVPEKTLRTALRFVEVLWSERTKENLVRSINPLQEVEIVFDTGSGQETRWLEFDFHRVRSEGKLAHLLVSVNDVTHRVRLGRELAELRDKAQSQVDTLLGVLQVNPEQLRSFLADADTSMRMINAMLREPAREESALRRKIETIFRQMHSIKGEASALGLNTVQSRAHEFEDALKTLGEKETVAGGDFLTLAVRLDDLFSHLESLGDLVTRLGQHGSLTATAADESGAGPVAAAAPRPALDQARAANGVLDTLDQLVERVAQDRGKAARLVTHGLDIVPEAYRRAFKDIAVQAIRNSLVHGIETPELRQLGGKPATGTLTIHFRDEGEGGFRLVIEDDGAGLSLRKIREVAVDRGILTADDAARLDSKQLLPLLFRPGFSTQEFADGDAGRGVGMSVVAEIVKDANGRLGISSGEGRYTRLTVVFPPLSAAKSAAVA